MINSLSIHGFKRFENIQIDLKELTVLSGINGSGKTSIIHALVLLHEFSGTPESATVGLLSPSLGELGTAGEVKNWKCQDSISFSIAYNETNLISDWKFEIAEEDLFYLVTKQSPKEVPFPFQNVPRAFTYLCAERLGPRRTLRAGPRTIDNLSVGVQGEYSAHLLASLGNRPSPYPERSSPARKMGSQGAALLKYDVELWMSELVRPIEIDSVLHPRLGVAELKYRTPGEINWSSAPNMGFGISYALPIILAGLTAERGGLLVVENPEAHLHPAGQSRMGDFLSWIASNGVQVLLETHSDHVLNGIRRAIGEARTINSNQAIIHHLATGDTGEVIHSKLNFTDIGGISDWPSGFFDQYQIDISSLGQARRNKTR